MLPMSEGTILLILRLPAADGTEIWDRVLSGSVSQTPTLADLDGDGLLEIVVGTSSGDIVCPASMFIVAVSSPYICMLTVR